MVLVQHLLGWRLPLAVLIAFAEIAEIYESIMSFSFVCCSGPILGANIMSLASSLAATACTNMTRKANVFTHNIIY